MGNRTVIFFLSSLIVLAFLSQSCEKTGSSDTQTKNGKNAVFDRDGGPNHSVSQGEQASHTGKLPRVTRSKLLPVSPRVSSELSVDADGEPNDDPSFTLRYQWYVNGTALAGENSTRLKGKFSKHDTVSVDIIPEASGIQGQAITHSTVIENSPPFAKPELSNVVITDSHFAGKIDAVDPDGDRLIFALKEAPLGMAINPDTGEIQWDFHQSDEGERKIVVSIRDTDNAETLLAIPLNIRRDEAKK